MTDNENIELAELLFYYYNVEGNSELTCCDELVCSEDLYAE